MLQTSRQNTPTYRQFPSMIQSRVNILIFPICFYVCRHENDMKGKVETCVVELQAETWVSLCCSNRDGHILTWWRWVKLYCRNGEGHILTCWHSAGFWSQRTHSLTSIQGNKKCQSLPDSFSIAVKAVTQIAVTSLKAWQTANWKYTFNVSCLCANMKGWNWDTGVIVPCDSIHCHDSWTWLLSATSRGQKAVQEICGWVWGLHVSVHRHCVIVWAVLHILSVGLQTAYKHRRGDRSTDNSPQPSTANNEATSAQINISLCNQLLTTWDRT